MIIIKRKTGDIFVNESETVSVFHDRDTHIAMVNSSKQGYGTIFRRPPIDKVESVTYINEHTGKEWKDEGSQVAYLQRHKADMSAELHYCYEMNTKLEQNLRDIACEVTNIAQYYGDKMPEDICKRLRDKGEEMKSIVNGDEGWMYRRQWLEAHKVADATEADETERLNNTIEEQAAEIRELKNNIEQLKREMVLNQPEPDTKSWWQRLWDWLG